MISPEREKELLRITDAKTLFQALCRELNIQAGERLNLNQTTPSLAKHIMRLSNKGQNASEIVKEIGLRKSMLKKK